jgi:dCMP deaminase
MLLDDKIKIHDGCSVADKRPTKEEYYLSIAREVARRGTCIRRNFGAVIVNNDQIISSGYTGAPRGMRNCSDMGYCLRDEMRIPSGERYELCRSVHAEMNAIIHASRASMDGGSLFLVGLDATTGEIVEDTEPCRLCKRVIINAGLRYVFIPTTKHNIAKLMVADWVKNEDLVLPSMEE